jgi:hypothetical protein
MEFSDNFLEHNQNENTPEATMAFAPGVDST